MPLQFTPTTSVPLPARRTGRDDAIGDRKIPISWRAHELRPDPVPTLKPEDPYLPAIWNRSVYPLAESLQVPIKLPSISPQPRTNKAFELLALAQDRGLDHPYSMRILRAFFQEDRDIGDPEVLVALAAEAGIDRMKPGRLSKAGPIANVTVKHCATPAKTWRSRRFPRSWSGIRFSGECPRWTSCFRQSTGWKAPPAIAAAPVNRRGQV